MNHEGLARDLQQLRAQQLSQRENSQPLASRRELLGWLVSASSVPIIGCDGRALSVGTGPDASSPGVPDLGDAALHDASSGVAGSANGGASSGSNGDSSAAGVGGSTTDASGVDPSCSATPAETGGPFPADSTIGPNVLVQSGILRSDLRSSFGAATGSADGIVLTMALTVVDRLLCMPLSGAVVYLWHCDREGRYSLYSAGVTSENYLRGAQQTNAAGKVSFTTIFPGCYPGRWPHMHFEVFPDLAAATTAGSRPLLTSQLAFTQADCEAAYGVAGYEASVGNLGALSLTTDGVFRDGVEQQLATISGDPNDALRATLSVAV